MFVSASSAQAIERIGAFCSGGISAKEAQRLLRIWDQAGGQMHVTFKRGGSQIAGLIFLDGFKENASFPPNRLFVQAHSCRELSLQC